MSSRRTAWVAVLLAVLIAGSTAVAATGGGAPASPGPNGSLPDVPVWPGPDPSPLPADADGEDHLAKLSEPLRAKAARPTKGLVDVLVHTDDVPALGLLLESIGAYGAGPEGEAAPFVARPWGAVARPTSVRVRLPETSLAALAGSAHVLSIQQPGIHATATVADADSEETREGMRSWVEGLAADAGKLPGPMGSRPSASPTSWAVAREHKAVDAWRLGYMGDGVNVAVIDTGQDFGHPSLQGQWATDPNPASPWYGWPIMFHPASMEGLMGVGWWTSNQDTNRRIVPFWQRVNDGDSWYTNTDYRINDPDGDGLIVYRDGTPDPVTAIPQYTPQTNPQGYGGGACGGANTTLLNRMYYVGNAGDPSRIASASGLYRLGVHRDDTLTGLRCAKVGLLLVDSTTPGAYDTVYVDLNFDLNFTNDKPVTKADPIAVADLNGDGVADLSGGLLYFIASSTPVVGEEVIASITGTETQAFLKQGWVATDIDGFQRFQPPARLRLQDGMNPMLLVPGRTEVIYEEYLSPPGRNDLLWRAWQLGGVDTTFGPINAITGQPINTLALLTGAADFDIEVYIDIRDSSGPLRPVFDFSFSNQAKGLIKFIKNIADNDRVRVWYRIRTYTLEPVSGAIGLLDTLPAGWRLVADYDTGLPVPYSHVWGPSKGYDTFIPANGDLVAFHGDFDFRMSHGTFVASTIAARPYGNPTPEFEVFGTAPRAKIIGIAACCNTAGPLGLFGSVEDQRTFAAVGYDGVPGTGDEAAIVSNSFGDPVTVETGFAWEDRWLLDYWHRYPGTTQLIALANNGMGYGTSTPGGSSPGVIGVGAGTSMDYRALYGFDGGDGYWELPSCPGPPPIDPSTCVGIGAGSGDGPGPYGDLAYFSSRGPTLLGSPKPDIVSVGAFGVEAAPLNLPPGTNIATGLCPSWPDGNCAFEIFSGTSQATPVTAGVTALLVQAYRAANGGADPPNELVRSALKSGADDMHRDVLQQGAGWTNALRSVRIMEGSDGVRSSLTHWTPGGYKGVARAGFVNFVEPGGADAIAIDLMNHDPVSNKTVQVMDAVYRRAAAPFRWSFSLGTGTGVNYVVNETGVWNPAGTIARAANFAPVWDSADFVKVTLAYDASAYAATTSLRIETHDWYDRNGDGVYAGFGERNRMTVALAGANANSLWDTIQRPGARTHHGWVLNLQSGASAAIPATLILEFYEKADWAWVTTSSTILALPPGGTASFDAAVSVPADAPAGMYEGAVYVVDGANVTTIPLLLNVPAINGFPLLLGGNVPATSLYENDGVVQGSRSTAPWRQTGDSRFVWGEADVIAREGRRLIYNAVLNGPRSDPEIYVYGFGADADWTDDAVFGPGTMSLQRVTAESPTSTRTAFPNREFMMSDPPFRGLVALQVKAWTAMAETEAVEASMGFMQLTPTTLQVVTNDLADDRPVSVWANVPLYDGLGSSVTQTSETRLTNVAATPDYCQGNPCTDGTSFLDWLCRQTTPNAAVIDVAAGTIFLEVQITSPNPSDDHDLGLWLDVNGNGRCDPGVDTLLDLDADADADETVRVSFPAAGRYLAQVGIWKPGSDRFNMVIRTGTIGVSRFSLVNPPTATVPPVTPIAARVGWDLPGSTPEGSVGGILFLAPGYVPYELVVQLSVSLRYDVTPPTIVPAQDLSPAPGSVLTDARTPVVANAADAAFGELDRHSVRLIVDGVEVTRSLKVLSPYSTAPDPTPPKYTLLTAAWEHGNLPFSEGVHTAVFFVRDVAGNEASAIWSWTVDTTAPAVSIVEPAEGARLNVAQAAFEAWTEAGATVTLAVNGVSAPFLLSPDGRITATLSLSEGRNVISVRSVDALGNNATAQTTVFVDSVAPVLSETRIDVPTLTNRASVTVTGQVSEDVAAVWVGGLAVAPAADRRFAAVVPLLEGENRLVVEAWDAAGNYGNATLPVITRDTVAPSILLDALPEVVTDFGQRTLTISGSVPDPDLFFVTVNGQVPRLNGTTGAFVDEFDLGVGSNVFVIAAHDDAGNVAQRVVTVSFRPVVVQERPDYNSVIASGVAVVLLILGFVVGYLLAGRDLEEPEDMDEDWGEPTEERDVEGAPEEPEGERPDDAEEPEEVLR